MKLAKRLTVILVAVAGLVLNYPAFAATAPAISISKNKTTASISPGESFSVSARFSLDSGDVGSLVSRSFSLSGYGDLILAGGSEAINNFNFNQDYIFTFTAPDGVSTQLLTTLFTVDYSYNDGSAVRNSTVSSTLSISVSGGGNEEGSGNTGSNYFSGSIIISDIAAETVSVGEKPIVRANIINDASFDIFSAIVTVSGGKKDVTQHIGFISAGGAGAVDITLDAFESEGDKNLTVKLEYRLPNNLGRSTSKSFYITVSEIPPLAISDMEYPDDIEVGADTEFKLKLVNRSDYEYKNAEVYFYNGSRLLGSNFVGKVPGGGAADVVFNHAFSESGTGEYSFRLIYENSLGNRAQTRRQFSLTVNPGGELSIINIIIPDDIALGKVANISFDIINKNTAEFSSAEAFIQENGATLQRKYIGKVEAQSNQSVIISNVFSKEGNYDIVLTATDKNGVLKRLERNINISPILDENTSGAAILKIQSIIPPIEVKIKTAAEAKISLTNPSSQVINGAEMSLFNAAGKELDSIYISVLEPNTMSAHVLNFNSGSNEGAASYRVRLQYKNSAGKTESVIKNFTVSVVESTEETETEPADVKIQKIEAPLTAYTNVRTKIPYTLINAGKGTAKNVEIYVVNNSSGEELAREYVGNIAPFASTTDLSYYTKSVLVGEVSATLYATFENYDGSVGGISKIYNQNVIDYRASITDISGTEWLMAGMPATIEFAVQNNGTEKLLNTQAYLTGSDGSSYGEFFIGTVEPGTKLERQKFKDVIFPTEGDISLIIRVTYENEDMQVFGFKSEKTALVQPVDDGSMQMPIDPGMPVDEPATDESSSEGGLKWWVWALIGVGAAIIVFAVIIIAVNRKKKKAVEDDEDIKFLLNQIYEQPAAPEENSATVTADNNINGDSEIN
ncbi:MAG: hypothetical protein LBR74_08575 [Eubacterium sp.]|jgi:hypothetical protein|nr:hypothetical protein [Eubacterium sp.]